jgi:uncharacterized protein YcbK (DUF882 family)
MRTSMHHLRSSFLFLPLFFSVFPRVHAQLSGPLPAQPVEKSSSALVQQIVSSAVPSAGLDTAAANPDVTEADVRELEEGEGAGEEIFISSAIPEPPMPVELGGNGSLTLTRKDTGEKLTARYRIKDGGYDLEELARLNALLRCSLTGREAEMSIKLIELMDAVEDHFGKRGLVLLSGYRTPLLNSVTPGAAKNSLHVLGWAADVRVPGYSSAAVKKYALKLGSGGVGYYPAKGFVHLDVGRVRYWAVRRIAHKRRAPVRKAPAVAGNTTGKHRRAPSQGTKDQRKSGGRPERSTAGQNASLAKKRPSGT